MEFTLPTSCAACGLFLEGRPASMMLCDICDAALYEARHAPHCPACASPLPDPSAPCGRCKGKGIRPFKTVARLGTFETTLRSIVHAIKYGRRWPLVPWVAGQLNALPQVAALLDRRPTLVPVPLHWSRRFTRGFNQAEVLAHALNASRGLEVVKAVRRIRKTPSQITQPSRAKRRRNMMNAFRVTQPELIAGKHVVLIDDVMTTGATLQAVARAMNESARPASICAVVIATANPLQTSLSAV